MRMGKCSMGFVWLRVGTDVQEVLIVSLIIVTLIIRVFPSYDSFTAGTLAAKIVMQFIA